MEADTANGMMKARNDENGQPAAAAAAEEASTAKHAPPRFDDKNADRERDDTNVDADARSGVRSASDFEEGDSADSGDDKDSDAYDLSDLSSFTNEFIWELYKPPPVVRLLMGVRVLRWAMAGGGGGGDGG